MKKDSLAIINFTFSVLMLTGCNVGTPQLGKSLLEDVVAAMTVEEKTDLLVGSLSCARTDTAVIVGIKEVIPGAAGTSNAVERLGIPNIVFADGPAGLRINPTREGGSATYHCTHFPIGALLASTWNPEQVENVGKAMGNEIWSMALTCCLPRRLTFIVIRCVGVISSTFPKIRFYQVKLPQHTCGAYRRSELALPLSTLRRTIRRPTVCRTIRTFTIMVGPSSDEYQKVKLEAKS